jgi:hypothetical protein
MAAYTTIKALVSSSTFSDRVEVALATVARDILTEADNAPNHPARIKWARLVLQSIGMYRSTYVWLSALGNQDTAEASITDANIYASVSANVDEIAYSLS